MIDLSAKVEQRELDRYLARLEKNQGRPLRARTEWLLKAAAQRELVPRIKQAAPVRSGSFTYGGKTVRGGNLKRKTKAKFLRKRWGEPLRPTWVGSTAWYSHLVARGTQPHSIGGYMHPGARANPFIDRGVDAGIGKAQRLITKDVFDVSEGSFIQLTPMFSTP